MPKPTCLRVALAALAVMVVTGPGAVAEPSPYSGMESRAIKAIPAKRVSDIKAGKGAGYAMTAELNGYPGPRHVLDLAGELKLSRRQRERTQTLFETMQREARALGGDLITREARLEAMFASERIDEENLLRTVAAIAEVEGRLRATHLKYHLAMKTLLSRAQIIAYNRLRGYDAPPGGGRGQIHRQGH